MILRACLIVFIETSMPKEMFKNFGLMVNKIVLRWDSLSHLCRNLSDGTCNYLIRGFKCYFLVPQWSVEITLQLSKKGKLKNKQKTANPPHDSFSCIKQAHKTSIMSQHSAKKLFLCHALIIVKYKSPTFLVNSIQLVTR